MVTFKIVTLKDVSVYQQSHLVLTDVNMQLTRGEFVYLIGKTGSGKSSLLKTIYAALPLTKGSGMVAGYDLLKLDRSTIPLLRRKLGIVFQDFNLLADRNVQENLQFVLRATGWKDKKLMNTRIAQVLAEVHMPESLMKMPHELSGGEQQRIVIARALLNHPELIIADEPTGNLDPDTSDEVMLLLRNLSKVRNTAVLFATHDYRIIEQFPARILRCLNGKVMDEESFLV